MKGVRGLSRATLGVLVGLGVWACGPTPDPPDDSAGAGGTNVADGVGIEYIAHASFVLSSPSGNRVLIDPYASRVWLGYDFPDGVEADAVLVTHPHYDHDAGVFRGGEFPWPGTPLITEPGEYSVGDIRVVGVEGKHADPYGEEFGQINTIFVVEVAGLRIAHLGDNGPLTEENVNAMGPIDVLMIPGDAVYHILSPEATQAAIDAVDPAIVIPMHYRIGDLELDQESPSDLGDVGPWLEGRGAAQFVGSNQTTLTRAGLPRDRTYLVFEHSPQIPVPAVH